ncbi:MAG: HAD family hydrolase [Deltaproteobacteria bacterium]|nr:HAD family hydrolase [Deltaproteobacteria bacterium]
MKHRAVLFDLDGTLLDTIKDLGNAMNEGLRRLGFPQHEIAAFRYFVGEGREQLAANALPEEKRDPATVGRLVDLFNREYSLHWSDHTRPYEGVPALLDGLASKDIKLAILSNKPHHFTKLMTSTLLSSWRFAMVVGALPSVPKKPDCTAALNIARQMDVKPSEFLYLGDSGIDMKTAVAAGMFSVGALWGFRTAGELKKYGADVLIERAIDLLDLL